MRYSDELKSHYGKKTEVAMERWSDGGLRHEHKKGSERKDIVFFSLSILEYVPGIWWA